MDHDTLQTLRDLFKEELQPIKEDILNIKIQLKEHGDILGALQTASEFHKADNDKLMHAVAHVEGEIAALRKDISTMEVVTASNYADLARLKAVK